MPFSATSPAVSCGFPVKRDVKNLSSLLRVHSRKKVLSKENVLCQGRINLLSAVPPCFIAGEAVYKPRAMPLCRIPTYPRELTHPNALQNTPDSPFPAPSAVHLILCFLPASQHRRLSVKASRPLSPLQRFHNLQLLKRILQGSGNPVKRIFAFRLIAFEVITAPPCISQARP